MENALQKLADAEAPSCQQTKTNRSYKNSTKSETEHEAKGPKGFGHFITQAFRQNVIMRPVMKYFGNSKINGNATYFAVSHNFV